MALTYKQRLFVAAYLGGAKGNATEAARMAGYAVPHPNGFKVLRLPAVRAAVEAQLKSAAMPAAEVLARLSEIASADIYDFITVDRKGGWKVDLRKARKAEKTGLIKKIKDTEHGTEIELHSPLEALKELARVHGLSRADRIAAAKWRREKDGGAADLKKILEADAEYDAGAGRGGPEEVP